MTQLNQNLYAEQARQNQKDFDEKTRQNPSDNTEYYKSKNEQFREKSKKFVLPAMAIGGGYRVIESGSRGAKKALSRGEELGMFQKAATSAVGQAIAGSAIFGGAYSLSKGLGRRQRIQEDRELAPQLGAAGKAGRMSGIYSQAGTLAALPMMGTMAAGLGKGNMSGLTSMVSGGSLPILGGIIAAQMTASFMKGKAKAKLRPKKTSEEQIVQQYNVSTQFQGQVNRLLANGELQPVDMLKLQYLGIIADRVGPLSAIYSEMDLQRKEKADDLMTPGYNKTISGNDDIGLFDRTLDFLEGGLTKTLAKYNPFEQITSAIFGGDWNPKRVQEDLAEQYGYKDIDDMNKKEAAKFGINVEQQRLLSTPSTQLIQSAPSYETKMLAILSGSFDIGRLQASELIAMRKVGMGVSDSAMYAGKPLESSDFTLFEKFKNSLDNFSIPGLDAISNIIKLPRKSWGILKDITRSTVEKVESLTLGKAGKFGENREQVLKELGLHKSSIEQSTEFIAHGLPVSIAEITQLSQQKLDMLQNIYDVSNLHYKAYSGEIHTQSQDKTQRMAWDELEAKYVTQEERQKSDKHEQEQILDYYRKDFRNTIPDILMKTFGIGDDTNDRMNIAGSTFDSIRKTLGMEYAGKNITDSISQAQIARRTPDSAMARKGYSEEQSLEELRQQEFSPKRTLKNIASSSAVGLGGIGMLAALLTGGAGAIPLGLLGGAAAIGGIGTGLKRSIGRDKKLQDAYYKDRGFQEGEEIEGYRDSVEEVGKRSMIKGVARTGVALTAGASALTALPSILAMLGSATTGAAGAGMALGGGGLGSLALGGMGALAPALAVGGLGYGAYKYGKGKFDKYKQGKIDQREDDRIQELLDGEDPLIQERKERKKARKKLREERKELEKQAKKQLNEEKERRNKVETRQTEVISKALIPINENILELKSETVEIKDILFGFSETNYDQMNEMINLLPKLQENVSDRLSSGRADDYINLRDRQKNSGVIPLFEDDDIEQLTGTGPKFADGGIVKKRIDNATVGESGPEAIIPLDQYEKSRTISQELKEVEQKKKDKESTKFQKMITGNFESLLNLQREISGNTDELSDGKGKSKKKGLLATLLGGLPLIGGAITALMTAAPVLMAAAPAIATGIAAIVAGAGILKGIKKLKDLLGIEDTGEPGSGASGSKTLDSGIKAVRTAANISSRTVTKKLATKLAEKEAKEKLAKEATKKVSEEAAEKLAKQKLVKEAAKKLAKEKLKSKIKKTIVEKGLGAGTKTAISTLTNSSRIAAKEAAEKLIKKKVATTIAKKSATIGSKAALKSVAFISKKIPIVGGVVGTGLALYRATKGDYTGAAMEFASGWIATIPVYGTAAGIAIDVGLLARDIKLALESGDINKMKEHLTPAAMKLIGNDPNRLQELQNNGLIVFNKDIKKYDSIYSSDSKKALTNNKSFASKASSGLADMLAKQGIVDRNWIGDSEIEDWDKIKKLKDNELLALSKYSDFDKETQKRLEQILKERQKTEAKKQKIVEDIKKEKQKTEDVKQKTKEESPTLLPKNVVNLDEVRQKKQEEKTDSDFAFPNIMRGDGKLLPGQSASMLKDGAFDGTKKRDFQKLRIVASNQSSLISERNFSKEKDFESLRNEASKKSSLISDKPIDITNQIKKTSSKSVPTLPKSVANIEKLKKEHVNNISELAQQFIQSKEAYDKFVNDNPFTDENSKLVKDEVGLGDDYAVFKDDKLNDEEFNLRSLYRNDRKKYNKQKQNLLLNREGKSYKRYGFSLSQKELDEYKQLSPKKAGLFDEKAIRSAQKIFMTSAMKHAKQAKQGPEVAEKEQVGKISGTDSNVSIEELTTGKSLNGIQPTLLSRLRNAIIEYQESTGNTKPIPINSGYRSIEDQLALYKKYGPGRAAKPGRSMHNFGYAVDINTAILDQMDRKGILAKNKLHRPISSEGWHLEPKGIDRQQIRKDGNPLIVNKVDVDKSKTDVSKEVGGESQNSIDASQQNFNTLQQESHPTGVANNEATGLNKSGTQQESNQLIDGGLERSIAAIFNSSSQTIESFSKRYVFDADVNYELTG